MRLTKLQREFIDEGLHEGDYVAFPDTGTKDGINKAHEAIAEGLRLAQLAHTNLPNEYNNGRMDVYQACLNVLSFYRGDGPLQKDTLSQAVESEQAPPVADTGELEAAIALVRAEQNKHCGYPGYSDFLVRLDELGSLADTAPQPVADPKQHGVTEKPLATTAEEMGF